jgi:signal transduction histidine kinase
MPFADSPLKGLPDRREILLGLRSPWVWLTLILSLALDCWIWKQAEAKVAFQNKVRFEKRITDITGTIQARVQSDEALLRGAAGLYAASQRLRAEEWRSYIASLKLERNMPGIRGVALSVRLRPGEGRGWAARARVDVPKGFHPWPAADGEEKTPIVYIHPDDSSNMEAVGFDMSTMPVRERAMEQACDHAGPALSGKLLLVGEISEYPTNQWGIVMYLPIFPHGPAPGSIEERRASIVGFVSSGIRIGDFMQSLMPGQPANDVGFRLYDGETVHPRNLLYQSENFPAHPEAGGKRVMTRVDSVSQYGRTWTYQFVAGPGFFGASDSTRPDLLMVLGALVSLLLAAGVLVLLTTRLRAQRLAETMTAELRALQSNLESLVARRTRELEAANKDLAEEMQRRAEGEEQLRQSQKIEAIGRMAGGIAHDFNNILTAINGYTDLSIEMAPPDSPLLPNLEEVRRAGRMASTLTRQLLAFSRKQVLAPRVVGLNDAVEGVSRMLRHLLGTGVDLSFSLSRDAGMVRVDPGQLHQVLINLVLNARDAMPEGGRISIETGRLILERRQAEGLVGEATRSSEAGIPPGRYCALTVTDSGHGMDEAVMSRLFEPYFTTKRQSSNAGTGLGLSTVYGIIRQSGGYIQVYSKPGIGTSFRILLPELESAHASVETA